MPMSAVSRCRNTPVGTATRGVTATNRAVRPQRAAGPSAFSAADDSTASGGQLARTRAASSRSVGGGVERSRVGRVVHQQVRVDVHSDQSARSSLTTSHHHQQPGRATPATDTRRSGLPRSSTDAAECRSASSNSTETEQVGRQSASAAALPPSSASSATGHAEKTDEELEKMRILARHIKV